MKMTSERISRWAISALALRGPMVVAFLAIFVVQTAWTNKFLGIDLDFLVQNKGIFLLLLFGVLFVLDGVRIGLHKFLSSRAQGNDSDVKDEQEHVTAIFSLDKADPAKPGALVGIEHLQEKHNFDALDCPECGGEGCKSCDDGGLILVWEKAPCGPDCPILATKH
ncbi:MULTISPECIES: hypothetical protein [Myxococcus]|uniref:hypothetical protein n=1 Tax=Myxococcus TaxID=32 RepID=UPI001141F797|nr:MULTISPECIES: hypothetical protein [Myxococcus]NOK02427.1 hypothetical protein [Myxococcus xanthus]